MAKLRRGAIDLLFPHSAISSIETMQTYINSTHSPIVFQIRYGHIFELGKTWSQRFFSFNRSNGHSKQCSKNSFKKHVKSTDNLRLVSFISFIVSEIMFIISHLDAIDVILLHSTTTQSIFNRKAITKEHLFRYLHSRKVPVTSEFTKQLLIEKILQFWKQSFYLKEDEREEETKNQSNAITGNQTDHQIASHKPNTLDPEQFPINQMAKNFANWFFDNLNQNRLQVSDFFCDCQCKVQFLEHQQCLVEEQHSGAEAVLEFCQSLLSKYNLYLNLNISHSGTQGRIDCHGLVLILTCGTLHKVNQFVGTFEAVFGLSRDPFSQNNWKMNKINIRLHNFNAQQSLNVDQTDENPTLANSISIAPLLSLAMPTGDDEIR